MYISIVFIWLTCCFNCLLSVAESCGRSSSLFPAVDQFVTSVVRSLGNKEAGDIWRWAFFSAGQLLIYDIIHNRWCANIQREHRSNNIKSVTFTSEICLCHTMRPLCHTTRPLCAHNCKLLRLCSCRNLCLLHSFWLFTFLWLAW